MTKKTPCRSKLVFGDDYGDNPCTIRCQRKSKHVGKHIEKGKHEGVPYKIVWGK